MAGRLMSGTEPLRVARPACVAGPPTPPADGEPSSHGKVSAPPPRREPPASRSRPSRAPGRLRRRPGTPGTSGPSRSREDPTIRTLRTAELVRYGAATAVAAVTTAVCYVLSELVLTRGPSFPPFTLAVALIAWRWGLGPGLWVLALSVGIKAYLFLPPPGIWVDADGAVRLAVWGTVAGAIAFLADRVRRLTETSARSEARFRAVFERAAVGIAETAPDGRFLSVNPTLCRLVGYSAEELSAMTFRDLTHPDDRAADSEQASRLLRGEIDSYMIEKRYVRRDGSVVPVLLTSASVPGPDGRPEYRVSVVKDITERKQADRARRESEDLLRNVIDHAPSIVFLKDADGRLRMTNRRFEELFGLAAGGALGRREHELLPQEFADPYAVNDRKVLQEGRAMEFTEEAPHPDGPRTYIVSKFPVRDADGRVTGVGGIATDITERQRADAERDRLLAELRETLEAARRADRSKDEFLAVLSHELRTPLNAILGWAQMLRIGGLPEEETARAAAAIERSARAQTQIIKDLLDVSRIVSGKLLIEKRPVDVAEAVNAAAAMVRSTAEEKGLVLETSVEPVGYVVGDAARIQQIVWNLLTNAVKFTPAGGRVRLRLTREGGRGAAGAACADGESAERPGRITLTVADTGRGISPEFLPHVFDRFRQADSSTTRRHGGLGLGLAIVKQLAELHAGTVSAASEGEGRGAVFTVALPPAESLSCPVSDGSRADRRLDGLRVMAVDDHPEARQLLGFILRRAGADVATAASAAEAWDRLRSAPPDAMICDIGMPGEDGHSLIRRIRGLPPDDGGAVPAAALTAFAGEEDRAAALEAGFDDHLAKPIDPSEVVSAVQRLVSRRRPTPSSAGRLAAVGVG